MSYSLQEALHRLDLQGLTHKDSIPTDTVKPVLQQHQETSELAAGFTAGRMMCDRNKGLGSPA